MVSKYNGFCAICKRPTKAGVDFYDTDIKQSYHMLCKVDADMVDESKQEDSNALADRLGFQ